MGTVETDGPIPDWKWLGKLPGGHQVENMARAKEKGRSKLGECTGKSSGIAGAANMHRSQILRCCLLACANWYQLRCPFPPLAFYPYSPSLPPAGLWGVRVRGSEAF